MTVFLDILLVTKRLITFEMPMSDLLWVIGQMQNFTYINCFGDIVKRKKIIECLIHDVCDDRFGASFSLKYGNNIIQIGQYKDEFKIVKKIVHKGVVTGVSMDTLFKEKEVLEVIDHVIDKFLQNKVFPQVRLCTPDEINREYDNTLIKEIGCFVIDAPGLVHDIPHILDISADLAEIKNSKDILDALQLVNVPFESGAITYSERVDFKLHNSVFKQYCQKFKKTFGSRLVFRTGFDLQDYFLAVKFTLSKKNFRFKMLRCYRLNDHMVERIAVYLKRFSTYIGVQEYILGSCFILVPYLELVEFLKQVFVLKSRPSNNGMEEIRVDKPIREKNWDNFRKHIGTH